MKNKKKSHIQKKRIIYSLEQTEDYNKNKKASTCHPKSTHFSINFLIKMRTYIITACHLYIA